MKYIKIQNKGKLPLKLLTLIGASTKSEDLLKIGEFGTGLKYAIAYFIRKKIDFKLFIGLNEIKFTTKEITVNSNKFSEIVINGKGSGITTQYGFQWKAWEAIREVWCNALDEKSAVLVPVEDVPFVGESGHTTFFIERTVEIDEVIQDWNIHFLHDEVPLYSDENIAIYPNENKKLKLYKNGVLIHTSEWYKSIFRYDLKKARLNELREYKGYLHSDIANAILNSNKTVTNILLKEFKENQKIKEGNEISPFEVFELALDYGISVTKTEKLKEIFQGYLFLNPDSSSKAISDKAVKVNKSLFEILRKNYLPTEEIRYGSGGYYGGGGYSGYSKEDIGYKPIINPVLEKRIEKLFKKYQIESKFSIAVPIKDTFDFLIEQKGESIFILNVDLEKLNDKDLEVIILIIKMYKAERSTYKALKRLIKSNLRNKSIMKLLLED